MVAPADLPGWWRVGDVVWSLDAPAQPLSSAALDRADGVLTGCAVAIAETGTIVLDAGRGAGQAGADPAAGLPPVRGAASPRSSARCPRPSARLDPSRPLTFISGPSATSDIELDRVEGVHGPRNLEVLIVGD